MDATQFPGLLEGTSLDSTLGIDFVSAQHVLPTYMLHLAISFLAGQDYRKYIPLHTVTYYLVTYSWCYQFHESCGLPHDERACGNECRNGAALHTSELNAQSGRLFNLGSGSGSEFSSQFGLLGHLQYCSANKCISLVSVDILRCSVCHQRSSSKCSC